MHKALALVPALALMACDPIQECDEMAAASVSIEVVDMDSAPLAPTSVTYTVDGGDALDAECMNDDCTSLVAGWEVAGEFEITVYYEEVDPEDTLCSWSDNVVVTVSVGMTEDECHVEGEVLTVELDPEYRCMDS